MSIHDSHWPGRIMSVALVCAVFLIAYLLPAAAQEPSIRFAVEVPSAPAEMQTYKLAPTRAPLEFLNEKLSAAKLPALKLEQKNYVVRGAAGQNDLDKVRVFANPVSGDTHFIPNLADLVSDSAVRERITEEKLRDLARRALTDERFIPRDATEVRIGETIPVKGSATTHSPARGAPTRTEPRDVMTIVPALRYVSGFRVYGRGSHAAISLANDGSTVGALRRWRTASQGERIQTRITADQVRADIERQLRSQLRREGTRATVDKIEVAYYDGNANYLQPVYYFEATLQPADKRISNIKIAGYVPLGKPLEPIPDLAAAPTGERPGITKSGQPHAALNTAPTPGDITLGEFANQDWPTSSAYLDMANNFFSGLASGSQPVSRTLWWTAYTWQVVGPQSKDWLNAVNVAYTEPHGDWLINSTLSNCCEIWNVADIGTGGNPGYGAAAGACSQHGSSCPARSFPRHMIVRTKSAVAATPTPPSTLGGRSSRVCTM